MRRVPRWQAALATTMALVGAGLWFALPELLVAATVPVAYVAYSALTSARPVDDALVVERSIEPERPFPGERVEVSLELTNVDDAPLPDVRVVDGVPAALPVADGSPRGAVSLRSGASATIEYAVTARRGDHEFDPVRVRSRSASAASVYTTELAAGGVDSLSSTVAADEWPLGRRTTAFTGRVPTDSGGDGLEFHSTRAYQPGDPIGRIDWRRYAKVGELTTIDYRKTESANVVVVVDARSGNHVAPASDRPTATELGVYAAARAVGGLLAARQRVGLAAIGIDDPETGADPAWVPPGGDDGTKRRALSVLDRIAAAASPDEDVRSRTSGDDDVRRIREYLRGDASVLLVTPALDEYPATAVERLRAAGHDVALFSPDVTSRETPGKTIARLQRGLVLRRLRENGATVVDWYPDEPIELALNRALEPGRP